MRDWRFNHIDFSTYPFYDGDDLGVIWMEDKTFFKIWAPTAKQVELRLYKDGKIGRPFDKIELQAAGNGCWSVELEGNWERTYYTFKINDGEWLNEVPDIYARCVGVNGKRGMAYDPEKTNPEGWEEDRQPKIRSFADAVIYESHVRDFSIAEVSGIKNKGKFLGYTETNTQSPDGVKTGLEHLKELGITHVHLLPVFDFFTVDEEEPEAKYNWGYDPQNYNALEGSYSNNPYDGATRIREFKELVKALHSQGIGVIMDVVYNHTGRTRRSVFNQTVPGYFYRQKGDGNFANASGCGNEIASERAMVRKYIIDSLKYWAEEFHLDGFRFDLMGIHDLETMKQIRAALDPHILLYGEGWVADQSPMAEEHRAMKKNIGLLPGIATFSDDMRDALKGGWGSKRTKGFVSGLTLQEESVKFGVVGSVYHPQIVYDFVGSSKYPWALEPDQCINYVSCHDNYTLWDKLKLSNPKSTEGKLKRMVKLAGATILTSQGIPFLHSGVEFCRTKGGVENSYKSPDSVNQLDWSLKSKHIDVFRYYQQLIQLRKNHPAFRIRTAKEIQEAIDFCIEYETGVVAYAINGSLVGDSWNKILVILNGNDNTVDINLPNGNYFQVANGDQINDEGISKSITEIITVDAISANILVLENS